MDWRKQNQLKSLLLEYYNQVQKHFSDLENPPFFGSVKLDERTFKKVKKRTQKRLHLLEELILIDNIKQRE